VDRRGFLAASAAAAGTLAARQGASREAVAAPAGRTVRVGMGQMLVRSGAVDENLGRAREVIARAGREQCAVVVLPECLDLGWTHPETARLARPVPGPSSLFAGKQRIATVAVSNVGRLEAGPWKGRYCIGSSLAVGGDGAVLARLAYGVDAEEFRAVDVPLAG